MGLHRVEFVVVGGVAAVLQGAPVATFDLDVVHERTGDNLERLLAALGELDARYRDLTGRVLRPTKANLAGDGHNLLLTKHGPLDVLGKIDPGLAYEELIGESRTIALGSLDLRVLGIPALIRVKEKTARPKDLAMLAVLRKVRDES